MSLDFYDSTGRPYAYSDDGETIYTFPGKPVAYIDGNSIYGFDGAHLGYFEDGSIRDSAGNVLLFTADSSGGPIKPVRQIKPIRGIKQIKPIKPLKTISWSPVPPEAVFER